MNPDIENAPEKERFGHLLALMRSQGFLENQGLGMEIPFYICPFPPQEKYRMEQVVKSLVARLKREDIEVLEIDLFALSMQLMEARGIKDRVLEMEQAVEKDRLMELMQGVLDPEEYLIPEIKRRMEADAQFKAMFITGVGEVFPFIRSHSVLNNLQVVAQDKPVVLFFPGAYTHTPESGASLALFGMLRDDKYYRAFNIYSCNV